MILIFYVTAVVREENRSVASRFISKDVLDITAEDLKSFDAMVGGAGSLYVNKERISAVQK